MQLRSMQAESLLLHKFDHMSVVACSTLLRVHYRLCHTALA
jgi:hypothetical protein